MHKAAVCRADGIACIVCTGTDGVKGIIEHQDTNLVVGCDGVCQLRHGTAVRMGGCDAGTDTVCGGKDLIDLDIAVDVPEKYDLKQPQNEQQNRYKYRKICRQLPSDTDLRCVTFHHEPMSSNLRHASKR